MRALDNIISKDTILKYITVACTGGMNE